MNININIKSPMKSSSNSTLIMATLVLKNMGNREINDPSGSRESQVKMCSFQSN